MIKYNGKNNGLAKALRKNMTPWERKLWFTFLNRQDVKFYRQRMIGDYIVDFYCPKYKLAIELDGSQHYEEKQKIYDANRTEFLSSCGIVVLRFTNLEIDKNFNGVCETIFSYIHAQ